MCVIIFGNSVNLCYRSSELRYNRWELCYNSWEFTLVVNLWYDARPHCGCLCIPVEDRPANVNIRGRLLFLGIYVIRVGNVCSTSWEIML